MVPLACPLDQLHTKPSWELDQAPATPERIATECSGRSHFTSGVGPLLQRCRPSAVRYGAPRGWQNEGPQHSRNNLRRLVLAVCQRAVAIVPQVGCDVAGVQGAPGPGALRMGMCDRVQKSVNMRGKCDCRVWTSVGASHAWQQRGEDACHTHPWPPTPPFAPLAPQPLPCNAPPLPSPPLLAPQPFRQLDISL